MNPITLLMGQQVREWQRTRLLHLFLSILTLLWLFCLYTGMSWFGHNKTIRAWAAENNRQQWLQQDRKHPHVAAHFGNFAYKPANVLSIIDNGTEPFTGSYVYMEAHRQNDVLFSPAQNSSSLVRFGSFNIAFLLQVLIPLFLIILTFNSTLSERVNGTLSLLKSTGISSRQIAVAKILAPFLLVSLAVCALFALSALALTLFQAISFTADDVARCGLLLLCYLAYYFLICCLGVYVSTIASSVKQSLVMLLSGWVVACILMPKLVSTLAVSLYPLPSNTQFKDAVAKDIANGINGHNPSNARAQAFSKRLLNQYGVDSTKQLPINIEGAVMMEGEKYSSRVFEKHFTGVNQVLLRQQRLLAYSSLIDPLLSIRNLSMGFCNTDYLNDNAFRQKAEAYRLNFVQTMNHDMMVHSKEDEFMTYKVGADLYRQIPPFRFREAGISQSLRHYVPEMVCLMLLTVLSTLLIHPITKKL